MHGVTHQNCCLHEPQAHVCDAHFVLCIMLLTAHNLVAAAADVCVKFIGMAMHDVSQQLFAR